MDRIAIVIAAVVLGGVLFVALREPPRTDRTRVPAVAPEDRLPAESFQAPAPGDRLRIELATGAAREGIVRRLTDLDVTIETDHGEVTYPRHSIAPSSRRLLFQDEFEGAPADRRPTMLVDEEQLRLLAEDDEPDPFRLGRNAQYVISGTNAIVIYRSVEQ